MKDIPMYLIGQQLEGAFEDQGVLGHLERVAVISVFSFVHCPISALWAQEQKILGRGGGEFTSFINYKTKQFWCSHINNQSIQIPFIGVTAFCPLQQSFPFLSAHYPLLTLSHFCPFLHVLFFMAYFSFLFCVCVCVCCDRKPGWRKEDECKNKIQITRTLETYYVKSRWGLQIVRLNWLFSKRKINRKIKKKKKSYFLQVNFLSKKQ